MYNMFNKSKKSLRKFAGIPIIENQYVKKAISPQALREYTKAIVNGEPYEGTVLTYPGTTKMPIDKSTLDKISPKLPNPDRLSKEGIENWLNNLDPIPEARFSTYADLAEQYHLTLQAAQILLTELNAQTKYMDRVEKLNDKLMGAEI